MAKHKKVIGFELDPDLNEELTVIANKHGMTRLAVVERGIEAFALLMERHERSANKASDDDLKELFFRLLRKAPMLIDGAHKVEQARLQSDDRPALILNEEWVIAADNDDDLMVVRKDGGQLGRIHRGRAEVSGDLELEFANVAALN